MKKFTKTCLILSAVIGVIGAGLFLAGMIIGPDWSVLKDKGIQYFGWAEKVNVLTDAKGFDTDGLETIYAKLDTEAKQEYEFSKEEVSSLSIETEEKNAIYLEFKTDVNANSIKVKSYNSADVVEYDREDRELSIEREGKNHQGEKDPITCRARVVLPEDSGPYTSMMRPRGRPPMPSARSSPRLPVEMASTCMATLVPSFITAPLPNCFSIWASAVSSAAFLSPAGPVGSCLDELSFFAAISLYLLI